MGAALTSTLSSLGDVDFKLEDTDLSDALQPLNAHHHDAKGSNDAHDSKTMIEIPVATPEEVVAVLKKAKYVVALTGAGVSDESGVPTFRNPSDGIWYRHDMRKCAHIDGFMEEPHHLWKMIAEMSQQYNPKPNLAHKALAKLEKLGKLKTIITQNVDGLHQVAGSSDVIEFHGNFRRAVCMNNSCKAVVDISQVSYINAEKLPPMCKQCNVGVLKPDFVLFGEPIPFAASQRAVEEASKCDTLIVVGTSAMVAPANTIAATARRNGAKVVEFNMEPTPTTLSAHLFVQGKCGITLPPIVAKL